MYLLTMYLLTIDVAAVQYHGGGLDGLPDDVRLALISRHAWHDTTPYHLSDWRRETWPPQVPPPRPEGDPQDDLLWWDGDDDYRCRPGDWIVNTDWGIVCVDGESFAACAVEVSGEA